jgi:hypothetical protein
MRVTIPDDLGTIGQQITQLSQQFVQSAQTEHDKQLPPLYALLPTSMLPYMKKCMDHIATDIEQVGAVWAFVGEYLVQIAQNAQKAEVQLTARLRSGEQAI